MTTDRLTVTVPSELAEAVRKIATRRHESVSAVVAEAIAHEVRNVALGDYLEHIVREAGPVSRPMLDEADEVFDRAAGKGVGDKRRSRRVA